MIFLAKNFGDYIDLEHSIALVGMQNGTAAWQNSCQFLETLNIYLIYDSAIP